MLTALKAWWFTRVQGHVASALMTLSLLDLTGFREDIERFIHPAGYSLLRLVGLGAIWYRAHQVRREPP